jgi:serpin B
MQKEVDYLKRTARMLTLMLAVVLAATALTGSVFAAVDVKALAPGYGNKNPKAATIAKGANDFAFRLSAALMKDVKNESFVCSPYSVWMPLAALVGVTEKDAQPALASALGATGVSVKDINESAWRLLYDLRHEANKPERELGENEISTYHNPLKIVNAIFVDKTIALNKQFGQTFADYYRGATFNVDFKSPTAVKSINNWASKHTEGLINPLLEELDSRTKSVIANAIYFSDKWQYKFDKAKTVQGQFRSPTGNVPAPLMKSELDGQHYYEDAKAQATALEFLNGGGLLVILPKTGPAGEFLSGMTSDYLGSILGEGAQYATVRLTMPRFKIDTTMDKLKDTLGAMGIPLFGATPALLPGIVQPGVDPLVMTGAIQKATIEVDEEGTTAAAVTAMPMLTGGGPMPTAPKIITCDRPFVFVLYNRTWDGGNQVLFTGIVNKP